MKTIHFLVPTLLLAVLPASLQSAPAVGGDFALSGAAVTGGGASQGGEFTLGGTAGEPATGEVAGGEFTLVGGLIGVIVVPGDAGLELAHTADGEARLSWSADTAGLVLEFSAGLGPTANWQPVEPAPTGASHTVPFNQPARFFRLRRIGP
jgi:hypothetical protein